MSSQFSKKTLKLFFFLIQHFFFVIKIEYNEMNRLYNSCKQLNADDKWEAGKSQYHRNKAQQRYENRIDTQVVQKKFIDIIRSYDNARNVLIHSYQAAFLMEKNTSA